jgi:hypothetical protein
MAGKTIISGTYSSGVMLSDSGYGSPLTVTGAINVSTGDAISYLGGTATNWIIANQGVIAASTKGSGIALVNPSTSVTSGSVTNSNGGTIYGGTNGIYINGYGKVTNIGASTISSQSTGVDIRLAGTVSNLSGGVISGTNSEAVFIYGAGKAGEQSKVLVFNAGLLQGSSGVEEFLGGSVTNISGGTIYGTNGIGVDLDGFGSISNSGLIRGGGTGIYLYEAGSIYNAPGGTILGSNGVVAIGGTVINDGTITGSGYGVWFRGYSAASAGTTTYYPSLLVEAPQASVNGYIDGGRGTLELASGKGIGTIAGIGVSVTNFTRLTIDQGAAWSIAGNATGLGAIGTIAGFTFNDTIDLTGFVAVNETFSGGKLVLTDAGAKHTATLNIAGSFASGDFQITSDNIDGTNITIPQTASWTGASGDWNTAASWDTNAVPSGVDIAVIAAKGNITVGLAAGKSIPITDVIVGAAGDVLDVEGTLVPTGTVTVKAGHINLGSDATIKGGTIADPTGSGIIGSGGTFDGVTIQGPLNIATAGGRLVFVDGLNAFGIGGTGLGVINLTTGGDANIDFPGNQTIDNATINLNGTDVANPMTDILVGGSASVLTLGANLIVSSQSLNTQASIRSDGSAQTGLLNLGTILVQAGNDGSHQSSFTIAPANGFENQGSISVSNNELLSIQPGLGVFSNAGRVSVNPGSTLQISSTLATPAISNASLITLSNGATLDLAGYFTSNALGNLSNTGATTLIDGIFDAQKDALTLGPGSLLNAVALNGQIRNAGIQANGSLTIVGPNASLENDTFEGPVNLTAPSVALTLFQNVILTNANQSGTINVTGQSDTLRFANETPVLPATGQTFDNVVVNIGNGTSADIIAPTFAGGTFTIGANADIISSAQGALAALNAGASTTVVLNGTLNAIANLGTFTIAGGSNSAFSNNGTMMVGNGDTLSVTSAIAGTGTIEISTAGVANFATAVAAGQTLEFTDATGILALQAPSSFAAVISGLKIGDTIDLAGIAATKALWNAGSPGSLALTNSGTAVATLSLLGDYSKDAFVMTGNGPSGTTITITPMCFAAGTRILTPVGELAIEDLRPGDLVVTESGKTQPIRWIGRRHVDFRHHPHRQRVLPVRVAANAFGPCKPARDLLLSPDHALFIDDVLIPVRHLLNGSTVAQIVCREITYYHIELPRHDVLLAEGLPAESYLEAGAREAFAECDGAIRLHADFAPTVDQFAMLWETEGYAPLVVAGSALERVRRRLGWAELTLRSAA